MSRCLRMHAQKLYFGMIPSEVKKGIIKNINRAVKHHKHLIPKCRSSTSFKSLDFLITIERKPMGQYLRLNRLRHGRFCERSNGHVKQFFQTTKTKWSKIQNISAACGFILLLHCHLYCLSASSISASNSKNILNPSMS